MKKRKTLYDRFQEDYCAIYEPANNKNGFRIRYVYYSPWYLWEMEESALKRQKRKTLLETAAGLAVFLLCAAIYSDVNTQIFIAVPALLALAAAVPVAFGAGQFFFAKYRTTRFVFEDVNKRLRFWPTLASLFAAAAGIGCLYYMIRYGFSPDRLAALLGYGLTSFLLRDVERQYMRISFTTEPNDTLKHVQRATLNRE